MIITKDTFLYSPRFSKFDFEILVRERGKGWGILLHHLWSKFAVVKGAEFIDRYSGAFMCHILLEKKRHKI